MAAIFRQFSFDPASRLPEPAHHAEPQVLLSVSPTSKLGPPQPSRLPTPPPCSVGELAHALDQQNLRVLVDSFSAAPSCEPLTPPSDDIAFPTEQLVRPPPLSTARLDSAILRRQRQANTRLQCSSSHIKDISALVEKMIEAEDQCQLRDRKALTPCPSEPSLDEDEGVDMEYTSADAAEELRCLLPFYRAGNTNTCTRVSKSVRMRKKSRLTKRSSK